MISRKVFSLCVFLLILNYSNAQNENKIILGSIDSIESTILSEKRKVWVYVPQSKQSGKYAPVKYPVVYLLDGDAHFYSVAGMIQQLSSVNGNTVCPEMIVVGIPNTKRTRDLTPTPAAIDPATNDSTTYKISGGGEKFTAFMEKELIPYIEKTYPTLPYRMLIGHSLGGLTVLNTLLNHKDMFNAYLAIDPSLWWDNKNLLNQSAKKLTQADYNGKTLYLAIANTMTEGMDTAMAKKDTSNFTTHIRSIIEMNELLKKNSSNRLKYASKFYQENTHGSVPLISTYDALYFIFKFMEFKPTRADYMDFSMKTIRKVEDHYQNVSRQFGFEYPVPEQMADELGKYALSIKKMDEAEYLFTKNVAKYASSHNAHDALADLYNAKGEKEKAIENYKKALLIKENESTRKKLTSLQQ
jgi:uncharacterized protein